MATQKPSWLANVTAYTVGGAFTSAVVGAGLGGLGAVVLPAQVGVIGISVALTVAIVAVAREIAWTWIPLPQLARQTSGWWAKTTSRRTRAPLLWGLDLGLTFTTWFTFSGVWLVLVLAVLGGDPEFGVALLTSYWFGRALSVWLAPLLIADALGTPALIAALGSQHRLRKLVHVAGLIWCSVVLGCSPDGRFHTVKTQHGCVTARNKDG